MEDERFKAEMMRMMGTVINKLDVLETDVKELKTVQKEHSVILNRLDSKTDSIADKVLNHDIRISKAEQNIENLQSGVH